MASDHCPTDLTAVVFKAAGRILTDGRGAGRDLAPLSFLHQHCLLNSGYDVCTEHFYVVSGFLPSSPPVQQCKNQNKEPPLFQYQASSPSKGFLCFLKVKYLPFVSLIYL